MIRPDEGRPRGRRTKCGGPKQRASSTGRRTCAFHETALYLQAHLVNLTGNKKQIFAAY